MSGCEDRKGQGPHLVPDLDRALRVFSGVYGWHVDTACRDPQVGLESRFSCGAYHMALLDQNVRRLPLCSQIKIDKPSTRVYYNLQEIGRPNLNQVLEDFVDRHNLV